MLTRRHTTRWVGILVIVCTILATLPATAPPAIAGGGRPTQHPKVVVLRRASLLKLATPLTTTGQTPSGPVVAAGGPTLTFVRPTSQLAGLRPGMILAAPVTKETPFGLLRYVTSVRTVGNHVVVQSVPAPVSAAISFRAVIDKTINEVLGCPQLSRVLYRGTQGITVTIAAHPCFQVSLHLRAVFTPTHLDEAEFTATLADSGPVSLVAHGEFNRSGHYDIFEHTFPPITVWVGVVPIVLIPEFFLRVGFEGSSSATITASTAQSASVTAGLACDDSHCSPVRHGTFSFSRPMLRANADAHLMGYVGPHLFLVVDGLAGPDVGIEGYVEGTADTTANPWWHLYAGQRATAQFRFQALFPRSDSAERFIPIARREIANSGGPLEAPGPTVTPEPSPSPTPTTLP